MAYGFNDDKSKVNLTYPLNELFSFHGVVCKNNSSENKYKIFIPIDYGSRQRNVQISGVYVSYEGQVRNISNYTALNSSTGLIITFTSVVDFSGYLAEVDMSFF